MDYFLFVVEGPHDAAFAGAMLRRRGFRPVDALPVDPFWTELIPTKFPSHTSGRLGHVVPYPDIYELQGSPGQSVAVSVSNGVHHLVKQASTDLEILGVPDLRGIALICDADQVSAPERFRGLERDLAKFNQRKASISSPGFPLLLPSGPGEVASGSPRVGIYVLPDNSGPGTIDKVLVACSKRTFPGLAEPACALVAQVDRDEPADAEYLQELRRGSGRDKATAGLIGNLLYPGSGLTTAIGRGEWFKQPADTEAGVRRIDEFLDRLLS